MYLLDDFGIIRCVTPDTKKYLRERCRIEKEKAEKLLMLAAPEKECGIFYEKKKGKWIWIPELQSLALLWRTENP